MYAPPLGAALILALWAILNPYLALATDKDDPNLTIVAIPVYLSEGGLTISVTIASRVYQLVLSGRLEGIYLFSNKIPNCPHCYEPEKSTTAEWCDNPDEKCNPVISKFECNKRKKLDYNWAVKVGPFAFDSLFYTLKTIQGYEKIQIDAKHISNHSFFQKNFANDSKTSFAGTAPIALITEIDTYPKWPLLKNISGIFGLVGPSLCCRETSLWWTIIGEHDNIFQIDINSDFMHPKDFEKVGNLVLGATKDEYIWSYPRHIGGLYSDAFMQFTIYNFKMCDAPLFGQTSSNWEAIIDPTSRCLGLPKNFWLSLMNHLPVDPTECINNFKESPRLCKLKSPQQELPKITFTLDENPESPKLEIPLQSLLFKLNENDSDERLCIVPTDLSGIKKSGAITTFPSIKFGYQVLGNFKIAVDQGNYRIGILNKSNFNGSDDVCSKKVTCIGDQTYCPAMNICLDPECSIWLLKFYDPNTGTCRFNKSLLILFWTLIALIGIIDLYSYFSYRRLITYTKRLCK